MNRRPIDVTTAENFLRKYYEWRTPIAEDIGGVKETFYISLKDRDYNACFCYFILLNSNRKYSYDSTSVGHEWIKKTYTLMTNIFILTLEVRTK